MVCKLVTLHWITYFQMTSLVLKVHILLAKRQALLKSMMKQSGAESWNLTDINGRLLSIYKDCMMM